MYKNKRIKKTLLNLSSNVLATLSCGFVLNLDGCASSHEREIPLPPSDGEILEREAGAESPPEAAVEAMSGDSASSGDTDGIDVAPNGASNGLFDAQQAPFDTEFYQVPDEVAEVFQKLDDPDFSQPLDELAAESCGFTQVAELVDESYTPYNAITDVRAFDASGRLVAVKLDAEIELMNMNQHTRLQIDYDSNGRPTMVRMSPIYRSTVDQFGGRGTIITINYNSDGSKTSRLITDEGDFLNPVFGYIYDSEISGQLFCETLRFDSEGGFTERRWGCAEPVSVQLRTYDEHRRPLSDRVTPLEPSVGGFEAEPWDINWNYDDSTRKAIAIWSEPMGSWISGDYNPFYLVATYETIGSVEQRLVRELDEAGRTISIQFDHLNDGSIDERVDYAYQEGELVSEKTDFWNDGMVDILKTRSKTSDANHITTRNMTGFFDSALYFRSVYSWDSKLVDIHSIPPGQGQVETEVLSDESGRAYETKVDARWPFAASSGDASEIMEPGVFHLVASWHETATYDDRGYMIQKGLQWQESNLTLQSNPGVAVPYSASSEEKQTTSCTYTSACDSPGVVFPEDDRLRNCETMVAAVFPRYAFPGRRPMIKRTDNFIVPPYDAVPGIQNTMKRRSDVFFALPSARDLIDY